MKRSRLWVVLVVLIWSGASCASGPSMAPSATTPSMTYEQKMAWILRLEEDRLLQSTAPASPPPPPVITPNRNRVAAPSPPPPPTLLSLLSDSESRIRRRAALAVGRTRLIDGVAALLPVLSSDADGEVRQMAAFALGLIGQATAAESLAEPLIRALKDPHPLVQGRAAEALGVMVHHAAIAPIATMIAVHTGAGVLNGIAADDLEHPKAAPIEAVRLGLYALTRLNAYEALATVLLDRSGRPISRWWPVAYAFRRVNDPRAGQALLALIEGDGTYTRAFAARGLGVIKELRGLQPLLRLAGDQKEVGSVRIEAIRSLADLGDEAAVAPLSEIVASTAAEANLRLEALSALGTLRRVTSTDLLVDLLTDPWPSLRAAALTTLARADAELFLIAISGLDPDRHWSVRAALAGALGTLDLDRAQPRLREMLGDEDQRVVPAVLRALVAIKSPHAEAALVTRLTADDSVVRQVAAEGLGRLKATAQVTALSEAYERAEKDPSYGARAAVLTALAELNPQAARPLLERALEDRDWAIRVRASALLRTLDPKLEVAARIRPAPAIGPAELNELEAMINPPLSPIAYLETAKGTIQIELAVLDAPRAVANFTALARRNFLGATPFHRVVPNFVVQDGDPRGDGEGSPGYTIRDEINQRPYLRGTVGMALDWEDTGGSQFFITHGPQPHLDGRYTVFGRVVQGMEVVDRLQQWDQIRSLRIWNGTSWIGSP